MSVRDEGPNTLALRADRGAHDPRSTPTSAAACGRRCCWPGPLLARCGQVELPLAGGDFIGRRRVDTHLLAFRGARRRRSRSTRSYRAAATPACAGAEIFLDEASVTATENALMAAVLAPGRDDGR